MNNRKKIRNKPIHYQLALLGMVVVGSAGLLVFAINIFYILYQAKSHMGINLFQHHLIDYIRSAVNAGL